MVTLPRALVQITKTKFQNPAYHLEKSLTARVKNTKCLLGIDGTNKMLIKSLIALCCLARRSMFITCRLVYVIHRGEMLDAEFNILHAD